jgi:hypothetical protein
LRNTTAERLHRLEVARADPFDSLIGIRLRHGADRGAGAVEIGARPFRVIVARRQAEPHPDHAVLGRQRDELVERVVLVAVPGSRSGEAGSELVLPCAIYPALRRPILESRELRADAAHVGGRAKDDRVGRIQLGLARFGLVDGNEAHSCVRDLSGASGHGFSQGLGMPVSRMIDDCDIAHDNLQFLDSTGENRFPFSSSSGYSK